MNWFNPIGLIIIMVMMIPNAIYAIKCKDGFTDLWHNKAVEVLEQVGRFGCFGLMIINIPYTWFGYWFTGAQGVYIVVNAVLTGLYCLVWAIYFNKNSMFRTLALSILPFLVFLFSGIMLRSILLIAAALIFAPCHILISCKNTLLGQASHK